MLHSIAKFYKFSAGNDDAELQRGETMTMVVGGRTGRENLSTIRSRSSG